MTENTIEDLKIFSCNWIASSWSYLKVSKKSSKSHSFELFYILFYLLFLVNCDVIWKSSKVWAESLNLLLLKVQNSFFYTKSACFIFEKLFKNFKFWKKHLKVQKLRFENSDTTCRQSYYILNISSIFYVTSSQL